MFCVVSRVSVFRCVKLGRGNVAVSVQSCLFEITVQNLSSFWRISKLNNLKFSSLRENIFAVLCGVPKISFEHNHHQSPSNTYISTSGHNLDFFPILY